MAVETRQYLDEEGVRSLWEAIKARVKAVPVTSINADGDLLINEENTGITRTEPIPDEDIKDECKN